MKSIITVLAFTASLVLVSFKANDENQVLTVRYTARDWQQKFDFFAQIKTALRNSDLPSRSVTYLIDSLGKIEGEMFGQLQPQIKVDTTKRK